MMQLCGQTAAQVPQPIQASVIKYPSSFFSASPNVKESRSIDFLERSNHSPVPSYIWNPFNENRLIQAFLHNRHGFNQLLKTFDRQVCCLDRDQYSICGYQRIDRHHPQAWHTVDQDPLLSEMQEARPGQTGGDNLTRTGLPSASFPDLAWSRPEEMKLNIVFFPHEPYRSLSEKEHPDRRLTAFR